jgi:antitoxin component YwqK of YwqJK toxin-antitoxin module
MKYIIHVYDYKTNPCKSITPLNASDVMHGEQKIYTYRHKCNPANLQSTNVRGWNHIASRMYENGKLIMEEAYTYKMFDITYTRNIELVKYTVRFEYKPDDVCIVSSLINDYLIEQLTKVRGVLHGPYEIYVRAFDAIRDHGKQYYMHQQYNYVDGKRHGPVTYTYLNGNLCKSFAYDHGVKHGECKKYRENGNLQRTLTYIHGERSGKEFGYNEDGTVSWMTDYTGGGPYSSYIYHDNGKLWYTSEFYKKNHPRESRDTHYDWEGNIKYTDVTHSVKQPEYRDTDYYCMYAKYKTLLEQPKLVLPEQILSSTKIFA